MIKAPENFFILSIVRRDGGAYSTTLIGHMAETMALNGLRDAEESNYNRFGQVVQRYTEASGVTWQVVTTFFKEK